MTSTLNTPTTTTNPEDIDWRQDANCKNVDPELFFPSGNGHTSNLTIAAAKQVCAGCPATIVTGCARYALQTHTTYGIWAGQYLGETANTRRTARKHLAIIAGLADAPEITHPHKASLYIGKPCRTCKRQLRPRNTPATEQPDTVRHRAHGQCDTCYEKTRYANKTTA